MSVRFARHVFVAFVLLWAPAIGAQSTEGDSLQVYLLTVGQGDEIWERFGHNAIGIRDLRARTDITYNWGLFDFEQPGFVAKFVRGDMLYWMAGDDAAADMARYVARNRSMTIQELNLSPTQRATLLHAIQLNAQSFFPFSRPGVIKTDALDKLAITGIARIGYHQIEKRTFLGAAARQSNSNHIYAL